MAETFSKRIVYQTVNEDSFITGSADIDIDIDFYNTSAERDSFRRDAPVNGECTIILQLQTSSGSGSVAISGKNKYGDVTQADGDMWTIASSVSVSTTAVVKSYLLHVSNPDSFDPNATGIIINIAGTAVNYKYRVIRV